MYPIKKVAPLLATQEITTTLDEDKNISDNIFNPLQSNISHFPKITCKVSADVLVIEDFLNKTKTGFYSKPVLATREKLALTNDKDQRKAIKGKNPYVTISGTFYCRETRGLIKHSGVLAADIDNVDPETIKSILKDDPYVLAVFASISGTGACVLFIIDGKKHLLSFRSIQEYLFTKQNLIVDPSGSDVCRPRYVSYDPEIYINKEAKLFDLYIKKRSRSISRIEHGNDISYIEKQIIAKQVDITGGYQQWLSICYAIADHYGEAGREHFHLISQFSSLYDTATTDRQYSACLKNSSSEKRATIATVYYYAKEAGLQIVAPEENIKKKKSTKDNNRNVDTPVLSIVDRTEKPKVNAELAGDTIIDKVQAELNLYNIERNTVTRKIEVAGTEMDDIVFNDIFCAIKRQIHKTNAELLQRIIFSSATPSYNPIIRFFERYQDRTPAGVIKNFCNCVTCDTGMEAEGEFFPQYFEYFFTKWLVGMISSAHGIASPLMLVLCGKQGNGKTEFFRRLLPEELRSYFAESKMDAGKDDEILMCKKWLLHDDEMSGKSKREENHLKQILSKQTITVREPYGHFSVDLKRLCVFSGTTNNTNILNDPTGNRRIIPCNVIEIDYEAINGINRIELFMEAYHLYKKGFKWELSSADVELLNKHTSEFEHPSIERELIQKFFVMGIVTDGYFMTTTEIKDYLEFRSSQKTNINRIGQELKNMGIEVKSKRINGKATRGYYLIKNEGAASAAAMMQLQNDYSLNGVGN